MTEKELKKLFEQKMEGMDFEFNESNWASFEQMTDPQEPLSEQAFKKLFRDKLAQASFPFNPENWEALEMDLGPENGLSETELQALFDKKISESEFAFNPENWTRMEAILDQRARKPLAFFWRSAAAIFIAAGLSALSLWQTGGLEAKQLPLENSISLESPKQIIPTLESTEPANLVTPEQSATNEPLSNSNPNPVASQEIQSSENTNPASAAAPIYASVESETYIQDNRALISGARPIGRSKKVEQVLSLPASDIEKPSLELPEYSIANVGFADLSAAAAPIEEPYIPQRYSKIIAMAGPSLSQAMNGTIGSPGYQAGIEYEYGLNKRAAFRTGLVYAKSGDIGIETKHDSTFFGLGRTEVETYRHYKSLKTLQIPVNFQYQVLPQHRFGVGLQTDILLSVVMDQTKTTTVFKQDPKIEESHFDQAMNSFEPIFVSAQFSYEYQYSDRLSLSLSYSLPLNDITNDEVQYFDADHRPGQANLQLRYLLFQKWWRRFPFFPLPLLCYLAPAKRMMVSPKLAIWRAPDFM